MTPTEVKQIVLAWLEYQDHDHTLPGHMGPERIEHFSRKMAGKTDEWIPVNERLPEIAEYVLVLDNGLCYVARIIQIDKDLHFFDYEDNEIYDVSYWQPLPQPPKTK